MLGIWRKAGVGRYPGLSHIPKLSNEADLQPGRRAGGSAGSLGSLVSLPVYMVGYRLISSGLTWTKNEIQLRGSRRLVCKLRDRYPNHRISEIKWCLRAPIARWIGAGGADAVTMWLFPIHRKRQQYITRHSAELVVA